MWVLAHGLQSAGSVFQSLYVRTHGAAEVLVPEVTTVLHDEAPSLTVESVRTLRQREAEGRTVRFATASTASGAGLLALLLASIGLYASVALSVDQRTREIGVRMAPGSRRVLVEWLFVKGGLRLALIGLALGLPMSLASLRWLLSGFPIPDILLGILVALTVLTVTAVATWLPARRAAGVDPMATLRSE